MQTALADDHSDGVGENAWTVEDRLFKFPEGKCYRTRIHGSDVFVPTLESLQGLCNALTSRDDADTRYVFP